jgi:hypothetical protein
LTFDKTVFRAAAGLQGQSAVGSELSLGSETMRIDARKLAVALIQTPQNQMSEKTPNRHPTPE